MLATPSAARSLRVVSSAPKRIVAIGDSVIYGYGDPEGGGWVERLRRYWMQPGTPDHALYNLGVRGDSVGKVLERLDREFRTRGELRNRLPEVLILSVGINDSARVGKPEGRHYTDFETFQHQMATLLEEARDLCPVFFVGMTPVLAEAMPFAEVLYYSQADQFRYKEATKQLCAQFNVPYLDIFDLWLNRGEIWWRSRLSEDGLHPNVQGYRSLFEEVTCWPAWRDHID